MQKMKSCNAATYQFYFIYLLLLFFFFGGGGGGGGGLLQFQHCTGHIMRSSFVGTGNPYIQLVKGSVL